MKRTLSLLAVGLGVLVFEGSVVQAQVPVSGAPTTVKKRRQPPAPIMPTAETAAAMKLLQAGNYEGAVTQAKAALNKNEKYTPAMMVMARAYYKLRKYEWVKTLWRMMQNNNATESEKAEMFQILAFLEVEKSNTPQAIELLRKAVDARPDHFQAWNNLGAQYLIAKNYREAVPALEKATQLNPGFAKAHLNLGSAYRGNKEYERAQASYEKSLQLFSNYADAVYHLGILYLDADKMPNKDTIARLNQSIAYFQKYKQMVTTVGMKAYPEVDPYLTEAQEKIVKEQKRIERQKKAEERERLRQTQKAAQPAAGAPAAPAAPKK